MASGIENIDASVVNDYSPSTAKTFDEFTVGKRGGMADDNYGVFGDISDWFTGRRTKLEKDYETYLQNVNAQNAAKASELAYQRELKATQDARDWDKMMSDTQYQRTVSDLKAAGLNPWLALQNGVSGSSVPNSGKASASVGSSSKYQTKAREKSTGTRDLSLLLFALARLAAV